MHKRIAVAVAVIILASLIIIFTAKKMPYPTEKEYPARTVIFQAD